MFTGIVEELGRLRSIDRHGDGARLIIEAEVVTADAQLGDSIAVNGCCLTVTALGDGWWVADAVGETLGRTNLGDLAPGDGVNLERPVRVQDRLGGHLVQGHVDATGEVLQEAPDLRVSISGDLARYVVEKGSITVDGCSLTVVEAASDWFSVAIIPHTAAVTTLGRRRRGDRVNLEVDLVAKYLERLVEARS